ncbi:uncharacterized protein LOC127842248 [Dreissena polymorpha]|nr:uncharacterized protein LOC127842248 [Dreissena polymorpha]
MSLHDMGDEFSADQFNMALKVVLKVEIQSLLDRLSQTGEETVLLFASADDQCTDHLASSRAKSFVDTSDIGAIKDKFLNYLMTGFLGTKHNIPCRPTPQQNAVQIHPPVTMGTQKNAGSVNMQIPAGNMNMQLSCQSGKRPLDLVCSQSEADAKKRKLDNVNVQVQMNSQTKILNQSSQASVAIKPQPQTATVSAATTPQKQQVSTATATPKLTPASQADTKLKTTKVMTSGGFTEERLSDAEFKKFLQQYKPEIPDSVEDDDTVSGSHVQQPGTGVAGQQPQRNFGNVAIPVSKSGATLDLKQAGPRSPQPVQNVGQSVKKEAVKDTSNSVQNVKTFPRKISDACSSSGHVQAKMSHDDSSAMKTPTKNELAGTNKIVSKIPLDDIENIDTETLVKLAKAKSLENMSEADRQIQEKLGQLSSKLSWVVEYPKNSKDGASASKQSPGSSGRMSMIAANMSLNKEASMMTAGGEVSLPEEYNAFEDEDEEDEEEYDEDEEFNEEGLDEEDREALRKIREEQKRRGLTAMNIGGNMRGPHFNMNDPRMEGFHIEQDQDYEEGEYEYEEFGEGEEGTFAEGEGGQGHFAHGYVDSSPHKDMFLRMGLSMAKCLICNKIVRNSDMKQHNEMHEQEIEEEEEGVGEGEYDDEEEEEEENGAGKGEFDNHEAGHYDPGQGKYSGQGDYEGEGDMEEGEEKGDYPEMAYTEEGMEQEYSDHPEQPDNQFTAEHVFTAEKLDTDILVAEKINSVKEKEPKVECTMCSKKLANARNLKKHMEKIHGQ